MKQQKSTMQKLGILLNTSSETFMLIALISLFAIPFVIASNLEPVVRDSERNSTPRSVARVVEPTSNPTPVEVANVTPSASPIDVQTASAPQGGNVLGVQSANQPLKITENQDNLGYFDKNVSNVSADSYSIELSTNQVFGKIPLLTLKNDSPEKHSYEVDVQNLVKNQRQSDKYLYINNQKFLIGSKNLPTITNLAPGQEVTISLISNKTKNTNIKISITLK